MNPFKTANVVMLGVFFLVFEAALPGEAAAYVDPGTTGMLSQILYVLFYGALGVFLYSLRYIKQSLANFKHFLAKLFNRVP
ncbi:MAG TPA: hypothetical protein VH985_09170 [Candidatus Binatia bacterium]